MMEVAVPSAPTCGLAGGGNNVEDGDCRVNPIGTNPPR